jgi:NAD(P)-dependent dehydrogenase (short-subunit alcohol dehydrogenase family)
MNTLAGKTAVVTGASRGSGRAAALALAKAGAQVIVHYDHDASEAEAVVGEIRRIGSRSNAIAADLSAPDGPHRLARKVRAIVGERLDILVANAGIATKAATGNVSVEDFDRLFAVNVRAPYFLAQQLLPIMCRGSSVTFLLPAAAYGIAGALSIHAASGSAVETLVRHFACVLGGRGIRANAIRQEPVHARLPDCAGAAQRNATAVGTPTIGPLVEPADVGSVVAFLASDAARWVTGATVHVNARSTFQAKPT